MTSDLQPPAPAAEISRRARVFCALATAILLWLPVQRLGWFPLAWLGLAPFLWAAGTISPPRARFRYGWMAGWLFYALTNWWIVPTVSYGSPMIGAPPALGLLLGAVAVAFIAAVHGLQFALAAWLWDENRWGAKPWLLPIIAAAAWLVFDFVRCAGPLSHIWGALAFTQWRDTPLLQIAPLVGQHGLTALLAWCGANLALWRKTRRSGFVVAPLCVLIALHGFGVWQLAQSAPPTGELRALLVSTNVPSLEKTIHASGESHFGAATRELWQVADNEGFQLAVVPETTAEVWENGGRFVDSGEQGMNFRVLERFLQDRKLPILIGATYHRFSGLGEKLYNTALLLQNGKPMQSSPKIRTVPMGEKAPFGEWLPFLRKFATSPEVTPGDEAKTMSLNGTPIGTVICFESCFPDPARSLVKKGAKALFIITNDEWFKGTNAPWEHATMAIFRAAENRVPVAQAANGGYTLLVDSRGRILHQSFGAVATPVTIPLNR